MEPRNLICSTSFNFPRIRFFYLSPPVGISGYVRTRYYYNNIIQYTAYNIVYLVHYNNIILLYYNIIIAAMLNRYNICLHYTVYQFPDPHNTLNYTLSYYYYSYKRRQTIFILNTIPYDVNRQTINMHLMCQ